MTPATAARMFGRLARALPSAVTLVALLAGLPWALLAVVGNPMTGLPPLTQTWISGSAIQHLTALFVWLLWAIFVAAVGVEAVAVIRGVNAHRLQLLSPIQGLAALLVAGLLSAPVASAAAVSPHPNRTTTVASVVTVAAPPQIAQQHHASATVAATDVMTVRVGGQHYTYRVRHGDTLWHIADAWLGNPLRWHDIYQLNRDHYDQHGRMRHGNLILSGWVLVLPSDATPPPGANPTPTPPPPGPSATPTPAPPGPTRTPTPTVSATPSISATPTPAASNPSPVPPRASTSATTNVTPTHTAPGSAAPAHIPAPQSNHSQPAGVSLRDGDWLDLGLAAALLAGGVLVWAHRRRRYLPQPPEPKLRLDDPDLAPLPEAIRRSRRILYPTAAADAASEPTAPGDVVTGVDDVPDESRTAEDRAEQPGSLPALMLPNLSNPITRLWPPAGVGLIGPGAEHAARGFLVTALADIHGEEPDARAEVVIPSGTLATLLGTEAVLLGDSPRLHVTAGLGDALTLLEQATLARTRLVYDSGADDLTGLREHDSFADPTPPLLLIADASAPHERTRITSVLSQGQRLDIAGILLGAWPDGNTVTVAADGTTTAADNRSRHGPHPADLGRLTVLGASQAADLLRTAIEAETGQAQPAPPLSKHEFATVRDQPDAVRPRNVPATDAEQPDAQAGSERAADASSPPDDATNADPAAPRSVDDHPPSDLLPPSREQTPAAPQPVRIRVLGGTPKILGLPPDSKDKPPLRVKSREMLAYLMAHPRGVTEEALFDEVLPDVKASKAGAMLNTYVYNLRRNLRAVAGSGDYVLRPKNTERCDLEPGRFDCDLWRMQQHLRDAQTAPNPEARIVALLAAIGEYTGPFADGHAYEWVEPVREAIRRQSIDAHVALATLLAESDRPAALAVLEQAIAQDTYNESLYQQAMRLYAADHNIDSIRQLRRDLTRHLADIQAEPSDETLTLADQLVGESNRARRGGRA